MGALISLGIYLENKTLYKNNLEEYIISTFKKLFSKNITFSKGYIYDELHDEEFESKDFEKIINKIYSLEGCYNIIEYLIDNKFELSISLRLIDESIGIETHIEYLKLMNLFQNEKEFLLYFEGWAKQLFNISDCKYVFATLDAEIDYSFDDLCTLIDNGEIPYSILYLNKENKYVSYSNGFDLQGLSK